MRSVMLGAVATLFLGVLAPSAGADHGPPHFVGSDPARGEKVHKVEEVSVTFDEALDFSSSELGVSACGQDVTAGEPEVVGDTISVEIGDEPPGTYVVTYSVSGLDDTPEERMEPTQGSYEFSLHYPECEDDGDGDNHHDGPDKPRGDGHHGGGGDHNEHGGDNEKGHRNEHSGHRDDRGHVRGGHDSGSGSEHADHSTTSTHDEDSHGHRTVAGDHHSRKEGHQRHKGRHGDSKDHGNRKHGNHDSKGPEREGPSSGSERPDRPNDALNLVLVLSIPALVGAVGGRALRARTLVSAS